MLQCVDVIVDDVMTEHRPVEGVQDCFGGLCPFSGHLSGVDVATGQTKFLRHRFLRHRHFLPVCHCCSEHQQEHCPNELNQFLHLFSFLRVQR